MALFARRDLQRSLNLIANVVEVRALHGLVTRLNGGGSQRVITAWEVAVLAAMSQVGTLQYERDLGGTRPDIFSDSFAGAQFVADVATVSDVNTEDSNPITFFMADVLRVAKTLGLPPHGFHFDVERAPRDPKSHRRLALPSKSDLQAFVRSRVKPFLVEVARTKRRARQLTIDEDEVCVTIAYQPGRRTITGHWPVYDNPPALDRNALYKALHAKARQLRDARWQGAKGVLVCDGRSRSLRSPWAQQIAHRFFERHQSTVSFIAALTVDERSSALSRAREIKHEVFWNPVRPSEWATIDSVIAKAVALMPRAVDTPENALHRLASPQADEGPLLGGWQILGEDCMRLSARAVLRVLGGVETQRSFLETHGFVEVPGRHACFYLKQRAMEGPPLRYVALDRGDHADDDWFVLGFGRDRAAALDAVRTATDDEAIVFYPVPAALSVLSGAPAPLGRFCDKAAVAEHQIRDALNRGLALKHVTLERADQDGLLLVLILGGHDAAVSRFRLPTRNETGAAP
jgi:hypothetical protein